MKKISAGILILVVLILAVVLLKDSVEVTKLNYEDISKPSEAVTNQFGELKINGFKWISTDVHWSENDTVVFYGTKSDAEPIYYAFDTNTLELGELLLPYHDQPDKIIYEDETLFLYLDDEGKVMLKNDQTPIEVIGAGRYNRQSPLLISENRDKIGYIDSEDKTFKSYDVSSKKTKSMKYLKGEFDDWLTVHDGRFSNDGGFISFSQKNLEDSVVRFSILGADSGKYYGESVMGVSPTFSPDSKTVGFIYSNEKNETRDYKIGLFKLKYKKISYLDTLIKGEHLFPTLTWDESSKYLYSFIKGLDNNYRLKEINVQTGKIKELSLTVATEIEKIQKSEVFNGYAYIVMNDDLLCAIELDTGRYNLYEGIETLSTKAYYDKLSSGDLLMLVADELWCLGKDGYRVLMDYDGRVLDIITSPDELKVAMLVEKEDEHVLKVTNLSQ